MNNKKKYLLHVFSSCQNIVEKSLILASILSHFPFKLYLDRVIIAYRPSNSISAIVRKRTNSIICKEIYTCTCIEMRDGWTNPGNDS